MRRHSSSALPLVALVGVGVLFLTGGALPASASEPGKVTVVEGATTHVELMNIAGDVMYLSASHAPGEPTTLWMFDGSTFVELAGSPTEIHSLESLGNEVFLVAEGDVFEGGELWSFDGSTFTLHAEVANAHDPVPAGDLGLAFAGDATDPSKESLYSIKDGVVTPLGEPLSYIRPVGFAGGRVYGYGYDDVASGLFVVDATNAVRAVPGVSGPVAGVSEADGVVYASVGRSLYRINVDATGGELVIRTAGPMGGVVEFGDVTYFAAAGDSETRLYTLDATGWTLVDAVPSDLFSLTVVDKLMYVGFLSTGAGVFDGTNFTSFDLNASYVSAFHHLGNKLYFAALTNTGAGPGYFDPNRTLYAYEIPPEFVAESPALAATGADASAPLALAALLLLAGGAAVGIRRRSRAEV